MVSAFSVPKAKRDQKIGHNPGPGQYNPQTSPKIVKPTDPKFSFGKQGRHQSFSKVPGPGSYEGKADFVKDKNPSYSLGGRKQQSQGKYNVGPGQYQPSVKYSKDKSPSYSIYGRDSVQMKGNKVGPGQYDLKSQLQLKRSGYQFSKDRRDHLEKRQNPGPGSYQYQNAVFKYGSKVDPSYGFGSKLKQQSMLNVPGPGQYNGNVKVYSKIGGIMSREMRNSYAQSKTPGPGNYEHDLYSKVKNHEPSWSLSKSSRDQMSKSIAIGPGAYDYDKNYKSLVTTNKGYNFGSQKKLRYDPGAVPGPGTYQGDNLQSKKGIKIGQRLNEMQGSKNPGPGSYENEKYDYTSWMKGRGKYSLGKGSRDDYLSSKVPGPGSYESNHATAFRGKVTFGRDSKLKAQKNPNPGPAQYNLKPTFADVPKYLLPDKS